MDVLRVAGVPGVGKSTVAWALAERLGADGVRVGYVDIDQLGMCYPAPAEDPDRWLLKEAALGRVAARFAEAGAERLVVSGVADPTRPPPGNGHPTVSVWMDADEETRRARLAPRGWAREQVDEVLRVGTGEADSAFDSWTRVSTDGSTVEEIVGALGRRWDESTPEATPATAHPRDEGAERVVWITGPRCAGASSVGWEIASARWRARRRTGFVDVAQLGFGWNLEPGVGTANVAELLCLFAGAGAGTLVAVAPLQIAPEDAHRALPAADLRFFRLDADAASLRDRAFRRAAGEGPMVAGDDLIGVSSEAVDVVVARAMRERERPMRPGEQLIDAMPPASLVAAQLAAVLPD